MAAAVVQLGGSVLIWHMIDWFLVFNGLLFIWGAFKKMSSAPACVACPKSQVPFACSESNLLGVLSVGHRRPGPRGPGTALGDLAGTCYVVRSAIFLMSPPWRT
jgi:hypothetical protein